MSVYVVQHYHAVKSPTRSHTFPFSNRIAHRSFSQVLPLSLSGVDTGENAHEQTLLGYHECFLNFLFWICSFIPNSHFPGILNLLQIPF